jgi:rubrerythrin
MKKLAEKNPAKVIDLLNERLTFERAGVKLYDAVLERMRSSPDPEIKALLGQMQEHRDEEKEHEEWLEEQIRDLGGDAHALTEKALLVQAESEGVERVVRRDPSIAHDLHALLTAELADNAGWDLLVQLADEIGDSKAKKEFKKRLKEEADHLLFVREAVLKLTSREVTQEPAAP